MNTAPMTAFFFVSASLAACGGSDDGSGDASVGGASGAGGRGGAPGEVVDMALGGELAPDAGASCDGITGTYSTQRRRDPERPGSCPETEFNTYFPIRVSLTADGSSYRVEAGYSKVGEDPTFDACSAVNVVECKVFATCHDGTDQVEFSISGSQVSGSIQRTDDDRQNCTINYLFEGERT